MSRWRNLLAHHSKNNTVGQVFEPANSLERLFHRQALETASSQERPLHVRFLLLCLSAILVLLLATSCGSREPLPWSDDFSNPSSGWKAESDAAAEVAYHEGVMRILIKAPNSLAWASAGRQFADFHLTVEAAQVSGPDNNEYGVLVRMQDPEHFYRFSISGDGYYLVSKHDGGEWKTLSGEDWSPSEAIHTGKATNLLEIRCRGAEMTFSVNGVQIAQISDRSYPQGDIALYAGSFFEPGVEVHFDNLHVRAP